MKKLGNERNKKMKCKTINTTKQRKNFRERIKIALPVPMETM